MFHQFWLVRAEVRYVSSILPDIFPAALNRNAENNAEHGMARSWL